MSLIQTDLINAVRSPRFVPFLGPDSSSTRESRPDEWKKVIRRFYKLFIRLNDAGNNTREGDIYYLETLAKAYHFETEFSDIKAGRLVIEQDNNDNNTPYDIEQLQYYLVKLGSVLVEYFGKRMAKTRMCVENLIDYKVVISDDDNLLDQILVDISGALDAVQHYRLEDQATFPSLETKNIYTKLLNLAKILAVSFNVDWGTQNPKHIREYQQIVISSNDKGYLRLDELAWLEDLLWHTLRFDVRDYLSVNEMTFRLSLNTFEQFNRRELLQVVTELDQRRDPADYIMAWIKYCEKGEDSHPSKLHLYIALAMLFKYEEKQIRDNKKLYDASRGDYGLHLPIVFSISFDRLLESAFTSLKIDHYIVFPVSVKDVANEEEYSLEWVYKSVRFDGGGNIITDEELKSCNGWKEDSEVPSGGPIIVKMHGSPAESLLEKIVNKQHKKFSIDRKEYAEIKHFVILSERNYFDSAFDGKSLPPWVRNQLKSAGDWWFLGYSINDWFMRLLISQVLNYTKDGGNKPNVAVVHPSYDALRTYVLHNLHVRRSLTELRSISNTLEQMPELAKILERQTNQND